MDRSLALPTPRHVSTSAVRSVHALPRATDQLNELHSCATIMSDPLGPLKGKTAFSGRSVQKNYADRRNKMKETQRRRVLRKAAGALAFPMVSPVPARRRRARQARDDGRSRPGVES
jgi:hypothetical protein